MFMPEIPPVVPPAGRCRVPNIGPVGAPQQQHGAPTLFSFVVADLGLHTTRAAAAWTVHLYGAAPSRKAMRTSSSASAPSKSRAAGGGGRKKRGKSGDLGSAITRNPREHWACGVFPIPRFPKWIWGWFGDGFRGVEKSSTYAKVHPQISQKSPGKFGDTFSYKAYSVGIPLLHKSASFLLLSL